MPITILWQLGTGTNEGDAVECFCCLGHELSAHGRQKLAAYRRVLVLHAPGSTLDTHQPERRASLLLLFRPDGSFVECTLVSLLRRHGTVRFEPRSGALWVGEAWLGEVRVGSREWSLLAYLAEQIDCYVPYGDLKREVLRRSGSSDTSDEATFCHGLKRRIKKLWIPGIDRVLVTTNKGEGYRLRGILPLVTPEGAWKAASTSQR